MTITVAYRGELFVDPDSGEVWRITRQAIDLPRNFPTHRTETIVDYRPVRIGATSYLLPVRSATASESTVPNTPRGTRTIRYLNDVRFIRYHRFVTESRLATDAPGVTPAPMNSSPDEPNPWLELDLTVTPPNPEEGSTVRAPRTPERDITIRTSTQLVQVPVVVKKAHGGAAITALKKEDFEIYDDGQRQDVAVFAAEDASDGESNGPVVQEHDGSISSKRNQQVGSKNHSVIILFDDVNTDWPDLVFARLQILRFLRELPEGSSVEVYEMTGEGLNIPSELQRDGRRKITPSSTKGRAQSGLESWISNSASKAAVHNTSQRVQGSFPVSLAAFSALSKRLTRLPGRKSLIWVSGGFSLDDCAAEPCGKQLAGVLQTLNDANVAVYPIDAPGLQTVEPDATVAPRRNVNAGGARVFSPEFAKMTAQVDTSRIHANQTAMLELASGTGGRAFLNANDITGAIRAAIQDGRRFYQLGFYSHAASDGRYHNIRVKLPGHPDARLRYRNGYFDRRP